MKGIIDIGSNSVRLLFDGQKKVITTRLAENMDEHGLNHISATRTIEAIKQLFSLTGGNCIAFATEAVRKAKNRDEFLRVVYECTGMNVKVLSGEEEAEISFLGASILSTSDSSDSTVIDLGGASCEIIHGDKKIDFIRSYPFGSVTMTDKFHGDKTAIENYVYDLWDAPIFHSPCFAVGGTVTSLAAMAEGLSEYDRSKVNGFDLTVKDIEQVIADLFEGKTFPTLSPAREKTIVSGAAAIIAVIKKLNTNYVTVSESDNLEGYMIKYNIF